MLALAVTQLSPDTVFNIVSFGSWSEELFPDSVRATDANKEAALAYINSSTFQRQMQLFY